MRRALNASDLSHLSFTCLKMCALHILCLTHFVQVPHIPSEEFATYDTERELTEC